MRERRRKRGGCGRGRGKWMKRVQDSLVGRKGRKDKTLGRVEKGEKGYDPLENRRRRKGV